MSKLSFVLAALLLSAAGVATAGVPVIELAPSAQLTGAAAPDRLALVGQRAVAAQPATRVSAPAVAADALVAERPQPPFVALLLLLGGCVVYLARHRGPGFALRPTRTLA